MKTNKKCVVWMESGVTVVLPDDVEIDSDDGAKWIKTLALDKFKNIIENDQFDITWEEL